MHDETPADHNGDAERQPCLRRWDALLLHALAQVGEIETARDRYRVVDCEAEARGEGHQVSGDDLLATDLPTPGIAVCGHEREDDRIDAAIGGDPGPPRPRMDEFGRGGFADVLDRKDIEETQQRRRIDDIQREAVIDPERQMAPLEPPPTARSA